MFAVQKNILFFLLILIFCTSGAVFSGGAAETGSAEKQGEFAAEKSEPSGKQAEPSNKQVGTVQEEAEPVGKQYENAVFVSVEGDDNNPGTFREPFKTIGKAVETATKPGDTIFVRAGRYNEAVVMSSWGAPDKPITLRGYKDERPLIDLEDKGPGIWQPIISIEASYIVVEQLELAHSTGRGIRVWREDHVQTDVTIRNVWVHHTVNASLFSEYCNNILIEDSKFWESNRINNPDGPFFDSGRWSGGLTVRRAKNIVIRRNEIFHSYGEGLNLHGGASNVLIQNNIFYDCHGPLLYPINSWNVRVEGNLAYHTNDPKYFRNGNPGNGIILGNEKYFMQPEWFIHDIQVVNNIVMGCSVGFAFWFSNGLAETSGLINTVVANNTFVDAHINVEQPINEGMWFQNGTTAHKNARIENNIIIQEDPSGNLAEGDVPGISFSNNAWSSQPPERYRGPGDVYGNIELSRDGVFEPGKLTADYFRLKRSSKAVDAGKKVPEVFFDISGRPRDLMPDIGALEIPFGPEAEAMPVEEPDKIVKKAEEAEAKEEVKPLSGIAWMLRTYDGSDWQMKGGIEPGDSMYGDRPYQFDEIPEELQGNDWVQTRNNSKSYTQTANPLAIFTLRKPADVYVAFNDNIDPVPEWLSDWEDTGKDILNDEPVTFSLYKKSFEKGSVRLGTNGSTIAGMYTVIIAPTEEN